ncbi:AAA family ATPase [Saccharothrix australiensis]|uniref:ATPase family protein associated with various cellular activities (AAA) n=1 Tax=Saccharothrix australiensis TaxID=2072 RepID=A0A495W1R1_9PSEU|nr:ATP-binding protein [Saccharothrix australiensis]RKT55334.1 ATPase family protein associated with various cellular activities (AAA) [Saccharothrix australiensis]
MTAHVSGAGGSENGAGGSENGAGPVGTGRRGGHHGCGTGPVGTGRRGGPHGSETDAGRPGNPHGFETDAGRRGGPPWSEVDAGRLGGPIAAEADLVYLWGRLGAVEHRVRRAVEARLATDPAPDDPFRGLYLTPDAVRRVLDAPHRTRPVPVEPDADLDALATAVPAGPRLLRLARDFHLDPLDVEFLLVALAPDVDARFERLYGYLNDDVTRRRATVGLALELCGAPAAGAGRFRFAATAPLVAGGLVEVREPDLPALSRVLHVPDRVVAHLLGDDAPDRALTGLARVVDAAPAPTDGFEARVGAALRSGVDLVHLRAADGDAGRAAIGALAAAGRGAVVFDVVALADRDRPAPAAVVREARLRDAGLVLGPVDLLVPDRVRLLREVAALAGDVPLVVHGRQHWDPRWTDRPAVSVPVPPLAADQRAERWARGLTEATGARPPDELLASLGGYRLGVDEVDRAVSVATRLAVLEGRPVALEHLRAGVRAQNGAGLDRLARRITPSVGWDDLVLPEPTRRQLAELVLRARHRDRVLGQWRMRPGGGRGRGVVALFAGESGTGKTMSAEVVAAEVGMDLYVVDLSTVVDKYVGETEKNLERIFSEAAGVHGVLLFDEADAVFGKRSEVKDARDRYANVESAYLLQRMESFDGIAVLTTNMRSNVDSAFTRRIDVIADFPVPDAEQRLALWDRCLGPALPRGDDLDLASCAERFELAGGSIRACAVTAAYLAAAADRPVAMADVTEAVRQEYRKLGRLVQEHEFGPESATRP